MTPRCDKLPPKAQSSSYYCSKCHLGTGSNNEPSGQPACSGFYGVRDGATVSQGLVTYTYDQAAVRLVIAENLRRQVATTNLYTSHQGLDSIQRHARQTVYWPDMDGNLQHVRNFCDTCNAHAPSQAEENFILTPSPEYPFQHTVANLLQLEEQVYLAYTDRCTGWLAIAHLPLCATSSRIMVVLRQYFARWGSAPKSISTDGGTNLTSVEVKKILESWNVAMRTSSPHLPQSNVRAETAVKSAKRFLLGSLNIKFPRFYCST